MSSTSLGRYFCLSFARISSLCVTIILSRLKLAQERVIGTFGRTEAQLRSSIEDAADLKARARRPYLPANPWVRDVRRYSGGHSRRQTHRRPERERDEKRRQRKVPEEDQERANVVPVPMPGTERKQRWSEKNIHRTELSEVDSVRTGYSPACLLKISHCQISSCPLPNRAITCARRYRCK
jgi:hypothetical protein